jgi:SNF2 family DNA or RNA helicase
MGLGKTVQVLALISTMPRDASVLLVMPTSLLFNWRQEIKRFLPDRALTMHHGSERRQDAAGLGQGIVLTSYALLRQDEALLTSLDWNLLVLDEAQAIKNPSTQTAKAAFRLRASMRLSLTGTPIENRLEELWSQFHFLLPGLLGDFASFAKQALAADVDARYLGQIRRQIRPFLLRRLKEDVAVDLPEKIEQVVLLELPQEQRDVYDRFVVQAKSGVLEKVSADGWNKHRMEVLELLLRLRQICCHPLLVGEEVESAKARLVLSDVATIVAEGKKVLVYSQFAQMLGLLRKDLATTAAAVFHIDGQTRDRAQQVNGFQEHEGPAVFLLSLKAAGVGLNLSAADYVLLYDPWWNDAAEAQAIDRAHRIGRQGTVLAKRYIVRETVEEKMLQLKQRKQGLAASILEDREGSVATALNADDLAFLLA